MPESEIETMAKPISRTPTSAAMSGVSPCSTWRTICSSTTIASSTTSPTANEYHQAPGRFEAGTGNIADADTLVASVRRVNSSRR